MPRGIRMLSWSLSEWNKNNKWKLDLSEKKKNSVWKRMHSAKDNHTSQEKAVCYGRKPVCWELAGHQYLGSWTLEMSVQCSEHFLSDTVEWTGAECTHLLRWSPLWLWEHVRYCLGKNIGTLRNAVKFVSFISCKRKIPPPPPPSPGCFQVLLRLVCCQRFSFVLHLKQPKTKTSCVLLGIYSPLNAKQLWESSFCRLPKWF